MYKLLLSNWIGVSIFLCLLFRPFCCILARAPNLDEVTANVKANEKLYDNIELVYRRQYNRNENLKNEVSPRFVPLKGGDSNTRVVLQNGLIYFKRKINNTTIDKNTQEHEILHGYDGSDTKMIEDRLGNLHRGRVRDSRIPYANSIFLVEWNVPCPLSEFLSTAKIGNLECQWSVIGCETIEGLNCVRLLLKRFVEWKDKDLLVKEVDLWLAVERNYFPVLSVTRRLSCSPQLPIATTRAKGFHEISSGIWYPSEIISRVYNGPLLKQGKHVVDNTKIWTVEKVELDPKYPISLFRDIVFPDGMSVHEVVNEKITGEEKQKKEKHVESHVYWLLGAILFLSILVIAGYLFVKRRYLKAAPG